LRPAFAKVHACDRVFHPEVNLPSVHSGKVDVCTHCAFSCWPLFNQALALGSSGGTKKCR
jgi:hypothetical protein